ncbi:hypothetical protein [Bradyrhizobium sp. USDA 4508]
MLVGYRPFEHTREEEGPPQPLEQHRQTEQAGSPANRGPGKGEIGEISKIAEAIVAGRDELRRQRAEFVAQIATLNVHVEQIDRLLGEASPQQSAATIGDDDLISIGVAAKRARRTTQTVRTWCKKYGIGKFVAGRWQISARRLHELQKKI